ncbi:MAG: glycosyltransferase family 2 protein [bacterium]
MERVPAVAVVIIAWNRVLDLGKALESIKRQTIPIAKIICVDNGSTDGSAKRFQEMVPGGALVQNAKNEGFAHAANQGIQAAGEVDYLLLLNQDVVLDPDYLRLLVKALEADGQACGGTGCLLTPDGIVDSAGHVAYRDRVVEDRDRGELPKKVGGGSEMERVFGVSAAAALYRMSHLDALALPAYGLPQVFDRAFFSYLEDVDLDFRANLFGFHFLLVPGAAARHRRGSTGRPFAIRWTGHKNYWLMMLKNEDWASVLPDLPEILLFLIYRFFKTLFTDPLMLFADLQVIPALPKVLEWRRFITRHHTLTPATLRGRLVAHRLLNKVAGREN